MWDNLFDTKTDFKYLWDIARSILKQKMKI